MNQLKPEVMSDTGTPILAGIVPLGKLDSIHILSRASVIRQDDETLPKEENRINPTCSNPLVGFFPKLMPFLFSLALVFVPSDDT